jgi:signal peptidase I
MNIFLLVALFLVAIVLIQVAALWLAARVWRLPKRSWTRVLWVVLIQLFLGFVNLAISLSSRGDPNTELVVAILSGGIGIVVSVWLIRRLLGGSTGRSIGTWVVYTVLLGALFVPVILATQEFMGTYVNDANSMAPNIRGPHRVETLPDGSHLVIGVSVANEAIGLPGGRVNGGIVAETYEFRDIREPVGEPRSADRIICNKTKRPMRWDAIVIKYPKDTSILYSKRLVGLPGERIEIRDGAAWVNGEKLSSPGHLGPIRYSATEDAFGEPMPFEVTLDADEFFVLGDHTQRSADSRHWGPVRRDLIVGVVDLIYWPPNRWRLNP